MQCLKPTDSTTFAVLQREAKKAHREVNIPDSSRNKFITKNTSI